MKALRLEGLGRTDEAGPSIIKGRAVGSGVRSCYRCSEGKSPCRSPGLQAVPECPTQPHSQLQTQTLRLFSEPAPPSHPLPGGPAPTPGMAFHLSPHLTSTFNPLANHVGSAPQIYPEWCHVPSPLSLSSGPGHIYFLLGDALVSLRAPGHDLGLATV